MPDFSAATIVAAGLLPRLPTDRWRRRAGEDIRRLRTRRVAGADGADRALGPAFFFISAEDSAVRLSKARLF
jgi:hypothetical protein